MAAKTKQGTERTFAARSVRIEPAICLTTQLLCLVGNSNGNDLAQMDGMAPDGKISMFDLGMTNREYLKVPAVSEIFNSAYKAGARVHTNSWGNFGGIYGQMSYDVDAYLSENEDFLILFAAGNSGHDGASTIISPGNSKNCLSVGAMQLRGVLGDKPFDANSRIASFSSIGPTFDGRIKPDVVAPGDFIMSAFAGPSANLEAALSAGTSVEGSCAVHQMSGTSMATPVTAGTALLVRQYFMDSQFWGSTCGDSRNKFCRMGSFEPSGYLMKALLLHSGRSVSRYSDPAYDAEPTAYPSFELESPPDNFQGYGAVTLANILPLSNGKGLDPSLSLYVYDKLKMTTHSTYKSSVSFSGESKGPLKVTIAWFDPPSVIGSVSSLLIHDIDLVVRAPDGDIHWGNENYQSRDHVSHRRGHGDNKNPNEQVYIPHIRCGSSSCTYDIFIRAHSLFAKPSQNVALVITSSGIVTDPQSTTEWFGSDIDDEPSSRHHNQTYTPFNVELKALLRGTEYTSTSFTIPSCGHLRLVKAKLIYNHLHCGPDEALPSYIEVTLQEPGGKAVSIGGSDSSVGKAKITTEWPDDWNDDINGEYEAIIDLTDAKIGGIGTWNMYIMNSFSGSGRVSYDFSATLLFYGGASDTCAPTAKPTSIVTEDPYRIPQDELLSDYNTSYEIPFRDVSLGVREIIPTVPSPSQLTTSSNGLNLAQDRKTIGVFSFPSGVLQTVRIQLSAYDNRDFETFGTDAWLLAVIVTPPGQRTAVQVGGYHWLGRKDDFYYRHWPDPWLGRSSAGLKWSSARDVAAAALTGAYSPDRASLKKLFPNQGSWTVELAMGSNYPRTPVNFTGTVTLHFLNTECSQGNSCLKNVIKLNSMIASPPATIDSRNRQALPINFQSLFGLLCLIFLYCLVTVFCKKRNSKLRDGFGGLRGESLPEKYSDYGAAS